MIRENTNKTNAKSAKKIDALWITTTAIFIAMLIGAQVVTAGLGQLVTGSLVNLVLAVSVMTCKLSSGMTVAVLSPVFASAIGIGPQLWPIVPFIMMGNAIYVLAWGIIGNLKFEKKQIARIAALAAAAVCKFMTLYFGVVRIAVPLLMDLPEQQAGVISTMFALPQLLTATIGGMLALAILPVIEKIRTLKQSV